MVEFPKNEIKYFMFFTDITWYIPILYAIGSLMYGLLVPKLDKIFNSPRCKEEVLSWAAIIICIFFFIQIYYFSCVVKVEPWRMTLVILGFAFFMWLLFETTWQGVLIMAISAVVGTICELILIHTFKAYIYTHPDIFGIPLWIPVHHMTASIAVGNVGRVLSFKPPVLAKLRNKKD